MKTNIHPLERGLRVAVGLFLMSLSFWGANNPWFLLAIVPVATGLSGFCPLYKILGFSTCSVNHPPSAIY